MDYDERVLLQLYSMSMCFVGHKDVGYATHPDYRDDYSGIAFVHNEKDAEGFPDDVIAAWPSERTQYVVNELNKEIVRKEIDLGRYSLQYPITIENMVDDWEKVFDLWTEGVTVAGRGIIDDFARDRYQGELYTRSMYFDSHKEIGSSVNPRHRFVHNEEDAESFSDAVFVAWPTELTLYVLHEINEEIARMNINFDWSSLQYPITLENMVDDWVKVFDLWANKLSDSSRSRIDEEALRKYREDCEADKSAETNN